MDYLKVCRLCLKTDHLGFVQDDLKWKIFSCVSVQVTVGDGLSHMVCRTCIETIINWYKFKERVDAVQDYLKKEKTKNELRHTNEDKSAVSLDLQTDGKSSPKKRSFDDCGSRMKNITGIPELHNTIDDENYINSPITAEQNKQKSKKFCPISENSLTNEKSNYSTSTTINVGDRHEANQNTGPKIRDSQNENDCVIVDVKPPRKILNNIANAKIKWHPGGTNCYACGLFISKRDVFVKHVRSQTHIIRSRQLQSSISNNNNNNNNNNSNVISCLNCKKLLSGGQISRHRCRVGIRQTRPRYSCLYCSQMFSNKKAICKHTKMTHGIKMDTSKLTCNFSTASPRSSTTKDSIDHQVQNEKIDSDEPASKIEHSAKINSDVRKQLQCQQCRALFSTTEHLAAHLCSQRENKICSSQPSNYKCKSCDIDLKSEVCFSQHMTQYHSGVPDTLGRSSAVTQSKTAVDLSKHSASSCLNNSSNSNNRNNGEKSMLPNEFYCSKCNSVFRNVHVFTKHLKEHFNLTELQTICHVCYKQFKDKYELRSHRQIAHLSHRLVCNVCGLSFRNIRSLKEHKRKDHFDGDRETIPDSCESGNVTDDNDAKTATFFECIFCKMKSEELGDLKTHVLNNCPGPFVCVVCRKRFISLKTLYSHKRNVHNMKNSLDQTIKAVSKKSDGSYVSNKTKLECKKCQRTFTLVHSFSEHRCGSDAPRKYFCPNKCGFKTVLTADLYRHKKKCFHKKKPSDSVQRETKKAQASPAQGGGTSATLPPTLAHCLNCKVSLKSAKSVDSHLQHCFKYEIVANANGRPWRKCAKCDSMFDSLDKVRRHCEKCTVEKESKSMVAVSSHVVCAGGAASEQGASGKRRNSFPSPVIADRNVEQFSCSLCPTTFLSKLSLTAHEIKSHKLISVSHTGNTSSLFTEVREIIDKNGRKDVSPPANGYGTNDYDSPDINDNFKMHRGEKNRHTNKGNSKSNIPRVFEIWSKDQRVKSYRRKPNSNRNLKPDNRGQTNFGNTDVGYAVSPPVAHGQTFPINNNNNRDNNYPVRNSGGRNNNYGLQKNAKDYSKSGSNLSYTNADRTIASNARTHRDFSQPYRRLEETFSRNGNYDGKRSDSNVKNSTQQITHPEPSPAIRTKAIVPMHRNKLPARSTAPSFPDRNSHSHLRWTENLQHDVSRTSHNNSNNNNYASIRSFDETVSNSNFNKPLKRWVE